jgi:hypothetical protein
VLENLVEQRSNIFVGTRVLFERSASDGMSDQKKECYRETIRPRMPLFGSTNEHYDPFSP